MTISEFKSAIAGYLGTTVAALTVNGVDLGLQALNQARRKAELEYDFEFQRRLVTLAVDGSTGGDLDDVVLYGTSTSVDIKTLLEVGMLDANNNFRPVHWTTIAESIESNRSDNRYWTPRYPTDAEFTYADPAGRTRFEFANDKVYRFPRDTSSDADVTLAMEVYAFTDPWTASSTATVTGTLSPDATSAEVGTYEQYGTINDRPMYFAFTAGDEFRIYYTGTRWKIVKLSDPNKAWLEAVGTDLTPDGSYTASGTATGTATVTSSGNSIATPWADYGEQYLLWQSIVILNHLEKNFVYRQEGNLPPPQTLADQGLAALREWDTMKFEAFRRHSR